MRRFTSLATAALISSALLAGAPVASAATVYEHSGCSGAAQGGEDVSRLGTMNDKASSLRVYGKTVHSYRDASYSGDRLTAWSDQADLRRNPLPLSVYATWNDKISSWRTP